MSSTPPATKPGAPAAPVGDTRAKARLGLVILGLSLLIGLLISQGLVTGTTVLREGTYARKSVRAPADFEIEDGSATETKRREAMTAVPVVFDYDPEIFEKARLRVQGAFVEIQSTYVTDGAGEDVIRTRARRFASELGINLQDADFARLHAIRFSQTLAEEILRVLEKLGAQRVVDDRAEFTEILRGFDQDPEKAQIHIRNVLTHDEALASAAQGIVDMVGAREAAETLAAETLTNSHADLTEFAAQVVKAQIRPNLALSRTITEERRRAAAGAVIPVKLVYKKNQLIVGEGRVVTAEHALVMRWLAKQESRKTALPRWIGVSVLIALLIFFSFTIADFHLPDFDMTNRDFVFLGVMLIAALALFRLFLFLGSLLSETYTVFPAAAMLFLYPAAFAPMQVRFVHRFEVALVFCVTFALVAALISPFEIPMAVYLFVSSVVSLHAVGRAHRRTEVIRAGVTVGLVNVGMVGCCLLLGFAVEHAVALFVAAFLGGVLASLFVIAFSPLVEFAFGYTTPVSLLELANYEHPLLREIMTKTPGTFQHSVTIGSLAEAAAERIGANALLCRVGALFHDAGKSANPDFFVENQAAANPHDAVNDPYRSAEIIKRHVTEGVDLAR
ncbi:MAG: HDIG domain-containing protein, partial [Deltaproteobacteria bacterium]|nr:HDIG domain-containing protein [Deltaproteobacteria bacterium]